ISGQEGRAPRTPSRVMHRPIAQRQPNPIRVRLMPSLPGTTIPAAPSADTGNARTRREAGNGRSLRKDGQAQGGETATTNAFTLARETTSGSTRVKESSFANARPRFGDASKKN